MITLGDLKTPQGSLLRTHLTHIEFIEHSADYVFSIPSSTVFFNMENLQDELIVQTIEFISNCVSKDIQIIE